MVHELTPSSGTLSVFRFLMNLHNNYGAITGPVAGRISYLKHGSQKHILVMVTLAYTITPDNRWAVAYLNFMVHMYISLVYMASTMVRLRSFAAVLQIPKADYRACTMHLDTLINA